MRVVAFLVGLAACEAAVSTSVAIKQRKERVIREPIPIRAPSAYQGGVLAEKVTRQGPVTRWSTFDNDSGDMQLHYFHNVTHKTQSKKTLLGIWKGYEGDKTKNMYRSIVFDDGDRCRDAPDRRYSIVVELSKKDYQGLSDYMEAIEPTTDPCVFTTKVNFYTTDALLQLPADFKRGEDVGVVQWFDDPNAPHKLCRDIKCNYTDIAATIQTTVQEMEFLKEQLSSLMHSSHHNDAMDALLQSSSSILTAANGVLSQSLRVYEQLTRFNSMAPPTCIAMSAARPPDEDLPPHDGNTAPTPDPNADSLS